MQRHEDEIASFIRRLSSPPEEQLIAFLGLGRGLLLPAGASFIEVGEARHRLGFLHAGIVRYHVLDPRDGRDITKDFSFAPGFVVSFGSAVQHRSARIAITAIVNCVMTVWSFDELQDFYDLHIEWQKLGRLIAEGLYVRKEDRELSLLTRSAEERYTLLTHEFPEQIDKVPQHVLASYIGIAPESLSRLKARLNHRQNHGIERK